MNEFQQLEEIGVKPPKSTPIFYRVHRRLKWIIPPSRRTLPTRSAQPDDGRAL